MTAEIMQKQNNTIEDSATVLINTLALKKSAAGVKVYNLSAGEPKLPIHPLLLEAATKAMQEGKILYPPVSGISELKKAVVDWVNGEYFSSFTPDNCLVTNGGKLGIYLLLQLLIKQDDEAIITSPYWVSYPALVKLFGGNPVIVETEEAENWKLTPEKLQNACTSKTRVLFLNNAANPTGVLYTKSEIEALLDIAKQHNLLVISDEVYSGLVYDSNAYVSCGAFPQHKDNVIIIQSCSKNFGMTGWRIGFVLAEKSIIQKLTSLISQSTSGATTTGQWIALAAIQNEKIINAWIREEMQKRRDILVNSLRQYFGPDIYSPASALYVFISLSQLGVKDISSAEFCMKVLEEANIALVPGSAFGKEGYVRFSFGSDEADLTTGVQKLAEYLEYLKN